MGRPRRYGLDDLLRHARALWIESGAAGVTIRALSAASGASNGAVYHAFGSRDGVLARVWAVEADDFLRFQRQRADEALHGPDPVSALVAAALAPADYAVADRDSARLLLSADADELDTPALDDDGSRRLHRLRNELGRLHIDLARALWGRRDHAAVTAVRHCVVSLPGTLLLKADDITDPLARHVLEHAVRGVAAAPPPGPEPRTADRSEGMHT